MISVVAAESRLIEKLVPEISCRQQALRVCGIGRGPQSKFQDIQGYEEKPGLEKQN